MAAAVKYIDASVATDPIVPTDTTSNKKCKCKRSKQKRNTNYRKKPEAEKLKRGPKPKPKQIHSCFHCEKEFRSQALLETHVRIHTGDKPYVCMHCPRRFAQKHNLTIHVRIHTGEKPFQCDICSTRFSAQGNLDTHIKIHTGQKDHMCTICNKSFITKSELKRHMRKHTGIKNFKCDLCEAAYVHARDLKLHKQKKHPVVCLNAKLQNEVFNSSNNTDIKDIDVGKDPPDMKDENHLKPHLSDEKTLTSESNQSFPYEHKADKEMLNKNTSKVFDMHNCAICGEGFDYLTALAQHYVHSHKDHDTIQSKDGLP